MRATCGLIALALLLAACQGCRSEFDRGALTEALRLEQPKLAESAIQETAALKPEARRPVKLAVVFPQDGWLREQKAPILDALEPFKADGSVSEAVCVSDSMVPGGDAELLKKARYAAARYQADVLLLVRDATQRNQYVNGLSILDLTIVGAFLFPSSHCDALVMLEASFWDVKSGCLLGTAEGEGQASTVSPTFLLSTAKVLREARDKAAQDAAKSLGGRGALIFKAIPAGAPQEKPAAPPPANPPVKA